MKHTAALDPNAAEQVIGLTQSLAEAEDLTVIMITHSMQQACLLGDRVIMMDHGAIVFDISGEERENLTPTDLIEKFQSLDSGVELSDRQLLG